MELDIAPEVQLRLKQNKIIDRWREKAHERCENPLALENSAGFVMEHLAQSLLKDKPKEYPERVWMNLGGHNLEEVINEYEILKDVILETLDEGNSSLSEEDRNIIIEGILYYMGMAAWEISQIASARRAQKEEELKKSAEIKEQEKKWFETVLDYLPVGVLVVEHGSANILFVNKAANKLSGGYYPHDLDRFDITAYDAEGREVPKNKWPRFRCASGEKLSGYELTFVHPLGRTTVVIHSENLRSEHGEPDRALIVFQEIEERKRMEESTKAKMHDLEEQEVMRESFVASLTHDLRTPLTVARMYAETLERKIDPDLRNKTKKIVENIDHADMMIRDLLDANRISAGQQIPLLLTYIDIDGVIRSCVEDMTSIYGNRFRLHSPGEVIGYWCGKALRRVLTNLLTNAVKYGDDRPIDISLLTGKEGICIKVHNYGEPIRKEDQPNIFKQFHRLNYKKGKGWGIGLSLVKGLVEAHCGYVELQSTREAGTTFTIHMPWKTPETVS